MASRRGRPESAVPDIVFLVPIGGNPKGKRIKATRTNKERYAGAIRNGHAVIEAEREAIKALEKSEAAEAEAKANAGEAKGAESPGSTAGDKTDTKTTKAATASKEG